MKTNKNKVAAVVFGYYPKDVRVRREAETLSEEGYDVNMISLRDDDEPHFEITNEVSIYRINLRRRREGKFRYIFQYIYFIIAVFFKLSILFLKHRFDIVHIHNMPDILVFSALIPKILGAKIILDMHDPMPEVYMAKFNISERHKIIKVLKFLEMISIRFADEIITPNLAFKEIFIKRGCPSGKITIIMNTPMEKLFLIDLQEGNKKEPHNSSYKIMYHGTIVERHGLGTALSALNLIRGSVEVLKFIVYGRGEYTDEFLDLAEKLKLNDIVEYMGHVSNREIGKAIQSVDLGIIPNLRNPFTEINFPVRIFEYLAYSKPVLVPCTKGITDYFNDDEINFFEAGSPGSLAEEILKIYREPRIQEQKLTKAKLVYEKYSWKNHREDFLNIFSRRNDSTVVD